MTIIPGFQYNLGKEDFIDALERTGIAHTETSENFCPADQSLMKCRRENEMVSNLWLAAASLLAKKLAIPRTAAVFDFRVGPTGNIGNTIDEARRAAEIFFGVAERLEIRICVTLTDNSLIPCSAFGRLESLELLHGVLNNAEIGTDLDRRHVGDCVQIAGRACVLCGECSTIEESKKMLYEKLRSGKVLEVFSNHLAAQGSSLDAFDRVIHARETQEKVTVRSASSGFWVAPDIVVVKKFAKAAQAGIGGEIRVCADIKVEKQVGIRLLTSPGAKVQRGEPVVEIRYPRGAQLPQGWDVLGGSTSREPSGNGAFAVMHLVRSC
jgi:pyrimidine-nucleoside phosphorylase